MNPTKPSQPAMRDQADRSGEAIAHQLRGHPELGDHGEAEGRAVPLHDVTTLTEAFRRAVLRGMVAARIGDDIRTDVVTQPGTLVLAGDGALRLVRNPREIVRQ